MKKIKKLPLGNRGITLIEVVLAMAISAILLITLGTITNAQLHTYRSGDSEAEAQFQAQIAMNFIIDKLRNSAGLNCEKNNFNTGLRIGGMGSNKDISNTSDKIKPARITYYSIVQKKKTDEEKVPTYINNQGDYVTNNFSYDGIRMSYVGNEISSYIKEFYISPLPSYKTYAQCDGVRIELLVTVGETSIYLEGKTYFRNKK